MIFVTKFVTENNFPIKTRKFVLETRFFGTSRSLSLLISSKLLKFCKNHQNSTSIYRIFYRTFTVWYWISKSFLNCQTLESSLFNPLLDVQDLTCILSDSDLKIIKITNYRKNQIQNKEKRLMPTNNKWDDPRGKLRSRTAWLPSVPKFSKQLECQIPLLMLVIRLNVKT